jgi:coproporphyrinogen III oxidase-like Fe-S oxidoreductase
VDCVAQLGVGKNVTQLHLGGGTALSDDELRGLMEMLRRNFTLAPAVNIQSKLTRVP